MYSALTLYRQYMYIGFYTGSKFSCGLRWFRQRFASFHSISMITNTVEKSWKCSQKFVFKFLEICSRETLILPTFARLEPAGGDLPESKCPDKCNFNHAWLSAEKSKLWLRKVKTQTDARCMLIPQVCDSSSCSPNFLFCKRLVRSAAVVVVLLLAPRKRGGKVIEFI